ncbi:MAG: CoA pyrophosphatase [Aquabacterium sp.]|jgi:8-oxo-dGTP pyrophosphatase MutT (NUDIX family)|uniref:CoA pyrophosphatase n=1 Tax=Aquabacterium sp. TaxID=1872578 RepID=UPI003BAFFAF0
MALPLPFDPRTAALLPPTEDLPLLDPARLTPEALRERFANPPEWEADTEVERFWRAAQPVPAAVLVPLVIRQAADGGAAVLSVLLTQRTAHLKAHAGQVSFPGGRKDEDDVDARATALREAQEEVGLAPERVEVIGELPPYITGTGFVVTPVVGLVQAHADEAVALALTPEPCEVAEIFEVPLAFLMNPANHQQRLAQAAGLDMRYFSMPWRAPGRDEDHFIWGATAAMLRNLYRFLAA